MHMLSSAHSCSFERTKLCGALNSVPRSKDKYAYQLYISYRSCYCHKTLNTALTFPTLAWAALQHTNKQDHHGYIKMFLHSTVMWGLPSATISSLCNRVHPPEMETKSSKMMCACPCGRVIIIYLKKEGKKVTHAILSPDGMLGDLWSVQLGKATTTTTHFSMSEKSSCRVQSAPPCCFQLR